MRLIKSFFHAARGVRHVWRSQLNFRVQVIAAILVVIAMFIFPVQPWQKVTLLLLIMTVLILEIVNTASELLVDLFEPRLNHYVRDIKDLMAAAVFLASLVAVAVAVIIFLPIFSSKLSV